MPISSLLTKGRRLLALVCLYAGEPASAAPPNLNCLSGQSSSARTSRAAKSRSPASGRVSGKRSGAPAATASDRSCSVVAEIVPPPRSQLRRPLSTVEPSRKTEKADPHRPRPKTPRQTQCKGTQCAKRTRTCHLTGQTSLTPPGREERHHGLLGDVGEPWLAASVP